MRKKEEILILNQHEKLERGGIKVKVNCTSHSMGKRLCSTRESHPV